MWSAGSEVWNHVPNLMDSSRGEMHITGKSSALQTHEIWIFAYKLSSLIHPWKISGAWDANSLAQRGDPLTPKLSWKFISYLEHNWNYPWRILAETDRSYKMIFSDDLHEYRCVREERKEKVQEKMKKVLEVASECLYRIRFRTSNWEMCIFKISHFQ